MKTFKDTLGRTWTIEIHVTALKRVRSLVNVDLLKVLDGELLRQLSGDLELLVNVIYALVKPEADSRGITDEQFGQGMGGDAFDSAQTALWGELADFFPRAQRQVLAAALSKIQKLEAEAGAEAIATLDSLTLQSVRSRTPS